MAACATAAVSAPSAAPATFLEKSSFSGTAVPSLAVSTTRRTARSLSVSASGGKKTITKTPYGPSGDLKYKFDSQGRKASGKGVYMFGKKYGANVDGYSPIWTPNEWSSKGGTYEGGQAGILLWALTFGALLVVGVTLVYTTSALS